MKRIEDDERKIRYLLCNHCFSLVLYCVLEEEWSGEVERGKRQISYCARCEVMHWYLAVGFVYTDNV
jgi:hypothetical protein